MFLRFHRIYTFTIRCINGNEEVDVMMVKFNATLSELKAAQALHSFYAKNKHVLRELQHLTLSGRCDGNEESQDAMPKISYTVT